MNANALFACLDPRQAYWRLGPLPAAVGRVMLVGWRVTPPPCDAGVPAVIAAVLARALTSVARVTFAGTVADPPPTASWTPCGADLIRVLNAGGYLERIGRVIKSASAAVTLVSTRSPETAIRLFEEPNYPWWLQGQVALLSEPDAPPPDIDRQRFLALLGDDWAARAAALAVTGFRGILRPGVDGDLAGILSLSEESERELLTALERAAGQAGLDWMPLTEDAFATALSS